jgi:hypothetical protein
MIPVEDTQENRQSRISEEENLAFLLLLLLYGEKRKT